jgi:hypothetical protein
MSLLPRSKLLRAGLAVSGVAAIAAAAISSRISLLVVAFLCLLPVATSLSQAGRVAASLEPFEGRIVSALVWGVPIRSATAADLRVESVGAAGAGLLIYLEGSADSRTLLKVAQPRSWRADGGGLVIDEAAYVQWAGKRLARAAGCPAVALGTVTSGAA